MKKIFFYSTVFFLLLSAPCFGGEWNLTGSLNQGRECFSSVILDDGRVLVAGGDGPGGPYNSVEIYDPDTETWTTTDSMNYARSNFSLTKLADGKILATGGFGYDTAGQTGEIFDPVTETWGGLMTLNYSRWEHTSILLQNNKVLIVGGDSANDYKGCEIYNPQTNEWTLTGFCSYPKFWHTLELLSDGRVMAIGGGNSQYEHCEIYDPITEVWTEIDDLNEPRYNHTSHLLPNGNVMAIAGHWGNHYNSSCEIYDFATQQWTFTDSLEIGRVVHCSEKLLNNKILVMGGASSQMGTDMTCEIYADGQWQMAASFNASYYNFSSEILNDERVLVMKSCSEIYTWNYTPTVPQPQGPNQGPTGEEVTFSITPSDPDGDSISVRFNWSDGEISPWSELVPSGTTLEFSHSWDEEGSYEVRAQVCDQWHLLNEQCHNSISEWSNPINIEITGTPLIQISTEPINFGQVLIGSDSTLSVFVSNSGNGLLEINTSTELPFSVGPENLSIQPEGEEEIVITFLPLSTGFFEELLLVQSNDPENSEIEILLSGEGTELSSTTSPVLNITSLSAYPNPFNSELTISFSLAQVGPRQVKILIYNIKGQVIKTWTLNPGTTQVTWSGRDEDGNPVSSGVYFYRIKTGGDYQANGKVILLK